MQGHSLAFCRSITLVMPRFQHDWSIIFVSVQTVLVKKKVDFLINLVNFKKFRKMNDFKKITFFQLAIYFMTKNRS